jgi:hypothetical protein
LSDLSHPPQNTKKRDHGPPRRQDSVRCVCAPLGVCPPRGRRAPLAAVSGPSYWQTRASSVSPPRVLNLGQHASLGWPRTKKQKQKEQREETIPNTLSLSLFLLFFVPFVDVAHTTHAWCGRETGQSRHEENARAPPPDAHSAHAPPFPCPDDLVLSLLSSLSSQTPKTKKQLCRQARQAARRARPPRLGGRALRAR